MHCRNVQGYCWLLNTPCLAKRAKQDPSAWVALAAKKEAASLAVRVHLRKLPVCGMKLALTVNLVLQAHFDLAA